MCGEAGVYCNNHKLDRMIKFKTANDVAKKWANKNVPHRVEEWNEELFDDNLGAFVCKIRANNYKHENNPRFVVENEMCLGVYRHIAFGEDMPVMRLPNASDSKPKKKSMWGRLVSLFGGEV